MSLHIAICGQTNLQRILYMAAKSDSNVKKVREYMKEKKLRNQFVRIERCHGDSKYFYIALAKLFAGNFLS